MFDEVLGVDGDFSAAAGGIDDVLGDGVAAGVAAEAFDDIDSFGNSGAEVGGSLDEVALVEVVGADAAHEEFVDEVFLDFDGVIDLIEEDGLISHDDAGVREAPEGFLDLGGELFGVIGVDGDEEGVEFFDHVTKFRGDALREEDGDAGSDSEELNVGDFAEAGEEFFKFPIGEEEGIAAGEEDVADLWGAFEVFDGGVPLGFELLVGDAGDDAGAGAVSAVGGAAVGDEEEDAVRIAVDEAGDGHVAVFATGIGHFGGVGVGFFDAGDDLAADGAVGISGVDEIEEVGSDGGGELSAGEDDAGALFFAEGEVLFDLFQGGNAVFQLPLGGVPIFRGDVFVFPISWG